MALWQSAMRYTEMEYLPEHLNSPTALSSSHFSLVPGVIAATYMTGLCLSPRAVDVYERAVRRVDPIHAAGALISKKWRLERMAARAGL